MSDESDLCDVADQADTLRPRLVDDAQRIRWHDEVLQKDDACRWGGVDTLGWQMDVNAAADLLGVLAPAARRLTELLDERERLMDVLHAAWELMECSGKAPRDIQWRHLEYDHDRLREAIDEMLKAGWEPHEMWGTSDADTVDVAGNEVLMTDHHPSATSEFAWDLIDSIVGIEGTEGPVDVMAHTSTWFGKGPVDAMNAELAARGLESKVIGQTSGPTTFTRRRPTETCPTCGSAVPKYCMTFIDNHWGRCPDAWHTEAEVT